MRVLVINTMVPFGWGGAEELAANLVRNLRLAHVEAEQLRVPFRWYPAERLLDEMFAIQSMHLRGVDRVIGLKFPTYLVPHHNKTMWLIHQHRQVYDLWDRGESDLPRDARGEEIRAAIHNADSLCFSECRRLYAIAGNVAGRLRHYNNLTAEVLYTPLNEPEQFSGGDYGDYIFAGGRLSPLKRQELLIRAMPHVRERVRLVIAGPPDAAETPAALRDLVTKLGVEDRVTIDARFLPRSEIAALVNNALASAYIPLDEDAIGYVTMEACHAAKAVIACTDSGGLLELLRDGETGYVVPPEPTEIAAAIDKLAVDRALARRLGHQAREALVRKDITWQSVVNRLLV